MKADRVGTRHGFQTGRRRRGHRRGNDHGPVSRLTPLFAGDKHHGIILGADWGRTVGVAAQGRPGQQRTILGSEILPVRAVQFRLQADGPGRAFPGHLNDPILIQGRLRRRDRCRQGRRKELTARAGENHGTRHIHPRTGQDAGTGLLEERQHFLIVRIARGGEAHHGRPAAVG